METEAERRARYQKENQDRTRAEIEAGRIRVFQNMAESLMDQYKTKYGMSKIILKVNSPDPRTWLVMGYIEGVGDPVEENFWDFPTANLLATIELYKAATK